jgi:hypothetical protein
VNLSNGALTRFWTDVWFGEMFIFHIYYQLAALASDSALTVQAAWKAGSGFRYHVSFKRLTSQL